MRISACWIVKNEAENLRASIDSVKDCADEMIVVDTGSGDETIRVAKECGAQVYHFVWINDFSAARNYALSLATGDYVIFLDADEYFLPALVKEDGLRFHKIFEETNADTLRLPRFDIEKEDESVIMIQASERILRRSAIHYENKIHELPRLEDGGVPAFSLTDSHKIVHTGYVKAVQGKKSERNIALLQEERTELSDPLKLFMNSAYLMREYLAVQDHENACKHCLYMLDHHENIKEACVLYRVGFLQRFYHMLRIVDMYRGRFERKDIRRKIFGGIKENYPTTRDAVLADLHYQFRYDYREDSFLRAVEEIEPVLNQMPLSEYPDCRQAESLIFLKAAETAYLQWDIPKAFRFALHSMNQAQELDPRPVQIVLQCLKGNKPKDIAQYISELVDLSNPRVASMIRNVLSTDEHRAVLRAMKRL